MFIMAFEHGKLSFKQDPAFYHYVYIYVVEL